MSKVPWHLFRDCPSRAHLVVGTIIQAEGADGLNDSTTALAVLRRLARKQNPVGNYAATVIREAGRPEVYFAFNDETDAQTFSASMQAEPIKIYSGWATQRAFEIDSAMIRELEASFPPRKVKRSDPPEGTPRIGVRGGPRQAPVRRYDEE